MPVIVLLVIIAVVAVCAAAFFGYRAYKHRTLAEKLDKRDDDQVHYAFIVNPSKPQAEQRKQHIKEFCEAKHLTQIEFIETQLDKDGRACAFEALDHGADVVVAVGGDGTVRTVASALSGTGHALGIVPIGTGNLFARNMGIPAFFATIPSLCHEFARNAESHPTMCDEYVFFLTSRRVSSMELGFQCPDARRFAHRTPIVYCF